MLRLFYLPSKPQIAGRFLLCFGNGPGRVGEPFRFYT